MRSKILYKSTGFGPQLSPPRSIERHPILERVRAAIRSFYTLKLLACRLTLCVPFSIYGCSILAQKISGALRAPFLYTGVAFSKSLRARMYADGNMRINCERPYWLTDWLTRFSEKPVSDLLTDWLDFSKSRWPTRWPLTDSATYWLKFRWPSWRTISNSDERRLKWKFKQLSSRSRSQKYVFGGCPK